MSAELTYAARSTRPGWLRPRLLWLVPGLAIGLYAGRQAEEHGMGLAGIATLLMFGILPHLPVLLGRGQPHAPGQLAARAVPLFNATHHPVPPLVVVLLSAAGILSPLAAVAALAWLSHVVADLAFGQGLRTRDGWRHSWWTR
jgi:hypothetical protein